MKLAIVVGRNGASQGAVRQDTGVRTFFRTLGGGYSTEIRRVYSEVGDWGVVTLTAWG